MPGKPYHTCATCGMTVTGARSQSQEDLEQGLELNVARYQRCSFPRAAVCSEGFLLFCHSLYAEAQAPFSCSLVLFPPPSLAGSSSPSLGGALEIAQFIFDISPAPHGWDSPQVSDGRRPQNAGGSEFCLRLVLWARVC